MPPRKGRHGDCGNIAAIDAYITPRICRNSESCNEVGIKSGAIADSLSTDGPGAIAFQERGRDGGPSLDTQDNLAYSLNSPAGVRRRQEMNIASGMVVRRLTPTECLRLQGLPDDWLDIDQPLSDSAKYRMIGNGGVTHVMEWIGRRLIDMHERNLA